MGFEKLRNISSEHIYCENKQNYAQYPILDMKIISWKQHEIVIHNKLLTRISTELQLDIASA